MARLGGSLGKYWKSASNASKGGKGETAFGLDNPLTSTGHFGADDFKPGPPTPRDYAPFEVMREAGKSDISGKYGTMRGLVQSNFQARGLRKSGFMGSAMSQLGGAELSDLAGLDSEIASRRQAYDQGMGELDLAKQKQFYDEEAARKQRRYDLMASIIGAAGKAAAGAA